MNDNGAEFFGLSKKEWDEINSYVDFSVQDEDAYEPFIPTEEELEMMAKIAMREKTMNEPLPF